MPPSIHPFVFSFTPALRFLSNLSISIFTVLLVFPSPVECQITSDRNFFPASYPLAVRSPYINTWQNTPVNTTSLTADWPKHWNGLINGWSGFVRIDGIAWEWLGAANMVNATTIKSTSVSPTRTVFTISAGPMDLTISFFSPIETEDLTRQSLPFTYLSFECSSTDGASHEVEVYSDISAEWISGNRDNGANWKTEPRSSSVIHSATRQSPQPLIETSNIAEDGTVYYAMQRRDGMTYQSGKDLDVRGAFRDHGNLPNTVDPTPRAIDKDFVVFGIAVSLGNIISTSSPIVWSLGLVRDPIVNYPSVSNSSLEDRRPYFFSDPQFANKAIQDVIEFFLRDYDNAVKRADDLDAKILADATSASPGDNGQYYNLVAMAARQAMAGVDITFTNVNEGGVNRTDIKSFMRNTGIDTSVNNVPTLYSSFPAFLYLNATWGAYLLDSSLQYQNSSAYQNNYAAPSLGSNYPKAPGDGSNTEQFAVEDTASMLIMVLAHARVSGDGGLIAKYYNLLKTWADYLVKNALYAQNQVSSDNLGVTVSNSTKLAIKGIIGIGAMAQISKAFGNNEDATSYTVNASTFALQWKSLALGKGPNGNLITATYGNANSFALMYDLYADLLLETGLADEDVYNAQTSFIQQFSNSGGSFGIPLDSTSGTITRSNRLMFTAGALSRTNNSTRNSVVNLVFARASFNGTSGNFPVIYDVNKGAMIDPADQAGQASPAQGASFSLLALRLPNQTITILPSTSNSSGSSSSKSNAGVVAGAVVGAIAGLGILVGIIVFRWRRRRDQQRMFLEPRFSMGMNGQGLTPFMTQRMAESGLESQGGSSYDPYNNLSQSGIFHGQVEGSRVLPPGATIEELSPPAGESSGSRFVGGFATSNGSSEKHAFVPNRGNWDNAAQSGSGIGTYSNRSPSSFSQSGSSAVGSRYQASQRSDATSQLRQEVEGLRREMEQLRVQAREYEPPPSYT